MSDNEVLEVSRENRTRFVTSEEDREQLLSEIRAVVAADGQMAGAADYLCSAVEKLIG
jgi:hypothetical protein